MKTELIITISADGQVNIEVDGAEGPSCLDASRELEEALGRVTQRQKKPSFYKTESSAEVLCVRSGEGS